MNKWKLELTSNGASLGNVEIRGGILQGDCLSPLFFVLWMVPLSFILTKVKFHYEFDEKKTRLNHLLFMDEIICKVKRSNRFTDEYSAYV